MDKVMLLQEQEFPMEVLLDKERLFNYVDENFKGYYSQIKENGERALISVKNNKITSIRNRSDFPTLQFYKELQEIDFPNINEGLFDSEIVMLDKNGKSHFYNERDDEDRIVVAGIQLRNKSIKEEIIVKKFPVTIIIFDVLKINGEFMINKPYSERYNKLLKIQENERVKVAKNYNFKELWDKVLLEDLEGVVLKNPYSVYAIGKRDKNYVKIKNYKMGFVKVVKTESNNKGIKVYGYLINDERIEVEVQIQNAESIDIGSEIKIKWLDKVGNKLIQSTRA